MFNHHRRGKNADLFPRGGGGRRHHTKEGRRRQHHPRGANGTTQEKGEKQSKVVLHPPHLCGGAGCPSRVGLLSPPFFWVVLPSPVPLWDHLSRWFLFILCCLSTKCLSLPTRRMRESSTTQRRRKAAPHKKEGGEGSTTQEGQPAPHQ